MATRAAGRQYQIVIFGASGFTGQFVVEEVARVADGVDFRGQGLRWAVAGRSQKRLEDVLHRAAESLARPQLKSIDIIICDINDPPSLADMCKKASVVLDCVGPLRPNVPSDLVDPPMSLPPSYDALLAPTGWVFHTRSALSIDNTLLLGVKRASLCRDKCWRSIGTLNHRFYGEPVVKACVENGAHFVDISGEPQFLESMCLKYDSQAADKGVYIVGSSGFDSIPADLGVIFTKNSIQGTLTAVESFLSFKSGPEGTCIHDGTWQSAIHGIADQGNLKKLRKQLAFKPLPVVGKKLKRRGAVFYSNEVKQYAIPFLGADASVVKRTQRYFYENLQETPVQYTAYAAVGGIMSVIQLIFAGFLFLLFTKFSFGRKLLIRYPKFFSFGYFSQEGPTQKQMDESSFTMTFFGEGYSQDQDPQQGKPNVNICTQVSGPEAGYVTTPIAMVQAGVTILKEPGSLPKKGGVYTPGAAFSKTKLIERLDKAGIHFSVISKTDA